MTYQIEITPALDELLQQATKRSRYWLLDAVANKRDDAGDSISEAADDFVSENGAGSHSLANQILEMMGEEPVFSRTSRFTR